MSGLILRSPAGCFQPPKGALLIEPDGHAASGSPRGGLPSGGTAGQPGIGGGGPHPTPAALGPKALRAEACGSTPSPLPPGGRGEGAGGWGEGKCPVGHWRRLDPVGIPSPSGQPARLRTIILHPLPDFIKPNRSRYSLLRCPANTPLRKAANPAHGKGVFAAGPAPPARPEDVPGRACAMETPGPSTGGRACPCVCASPAPTG